MIESLRAWWGKTSLTERVLMGVTVLGGVLVVSLVVMLAGQSSDASDLSADVDASEARVDDLATENEKVAADLSAAEQQLATAQQQLATAEQTIADLEASTASQEQALAESEDLAKSAKAEAAAELADAKRLLSEAEREKARAGKLVAELTMAYSADIEAARVTLETEASVFTCEWGASMAADGRNIDSVTGTAALSAYASSDQLAVLSETSEIAAAIEVAETLGEDRYGVSADVVETIAVNCWQKEDAKINAALYVHQNVFRNAVMDAACTTDSADGVFNNWSGYGDTAVYQNWELSVGYSDAQDYIEAVEDRLGSIEAFVAIPTAEIEAESARCEDIRDLIEPKGSGTWNVGDEIMPGTWKAYDVSDCYWARLSENGNIRANHFGDGLRLSVNISSSDGQFEISGCTFYYANP